MRSTPSRSRSTSVPKKSLAGGVSSNVRYAATPVPLFFVRGEGARLFTSMGLHIDYVLGNGPAILRHAPAAVIRPWRSLAEGQVFAAQHPRADGAVGAAGQTAAGRRGRALRPRRAPGRADGHAARPAPSPGATRS